MVEKDEIVSSKYTSYLNNSWFALYFKTTKLLILRACSILYFLKTPQVRFVVVF